jgi:DNA-binding MarR family transcriptional regulator
MVGGKLEAAGFVDRLRDPSDRLVCRVALSTAGRRQVELIRSRRTVWLAEQLRALPPEDLARLADAVDVLERLTVAPVAAS